MSDNNGILKIIDSCFDGDIDTTSNEHYSTIYSYMADAYSFIKDWLIYGSEDDEEKKLKKVAFLDSAEKVANKIREKELLKVQKYVITDATSNKKASSSIEKKTANFLDYVVSLRKKYINRNFYDGLQEENQKSGFDNEVNGKRKPYEEIIYVGNTLKPRLIEDSTTKSTVANIEYYAKYEDAVTIAKEQTFNVVASEGSYYEQHLVDAEYFVDNSAIFYNNEPAYQYRPIIDIYITKEKGSDTEKNIKISAYNHEGDATDFSGSITGETEKCIHLLPFISIVGNTNSNKYRNTNDGDYSKSAYTTIAEENDTNTIFGLVEDEKNPRTAGIYYKSDMAKNGLNIFLGNGTYKIRVEYRYLREYNIAYIEVNNKSDNLYKIKIKGKEYQNLSYATDGAFNSLNNYSSTEENKSIDKLIETVSSNDNQIDFRILCNYDKQATTDSSSNVDQLSGSQIMSTSVVFSDGFLVDYLNNYENNISIFYELFSSIAKTLNDNNETKVNYFENYLKKYFYNGILERYRTNAIEDNETSVTSVDTNFERNKFQIINTYETLKGKGRNINGLATLDFGYYRDNGKNKFVNYIADKIIIGSDDSMNIYVNIDSFGIYLKTIAKYGSYTSSDGSSFLSVMANKYNKFKKRYTNYYKESDDGTGLATYDNNFYQYVAWYLKKHPNDFKEQLLRDYFFAIRVNFAKLSSFLASTSEQYTTRQQYFIDLRNKLEDEYFYDSSRNSIIDLDFKSEGGTTYIIIKVSLKNVLSNDDIIKLKSLEDKDDKGEYLATSLGSGILYTRRLIQKLKDNIVSKSKSDLNISRDNLMEPEEFYSVMDDRDSSVVITSDNITNSSGDNLNWDNNKQELVSAKFPSYKTTSLYNNTKDTDEENYKEGTYKLDVTDFSTYNDIEAIQQIRVVDAYSNSNKYLFNVIGTKKTYESRTLFNATLKLYTIDELAKLLNLNISYYDNNTLYLNNDIINSTSDESIVLNDESNYENLLYDEKNKLSFLIKEDPDKDNDDSLIERLQAKVISNESDYNGYVNNGILYSVNDNIAEKLETVKDNDGNELYNAYTLNMNNINSVTYYTVKRYLILDYCIESPKIYSNKGIEVKIIDYILSNGNSKFLELPQLNYDSQNNTTEYVPFVSYPKNIPGDSLKKTIISSKPDIYLKFGGKINIINKTQYKIKSTKFNGYKFLIPFRVGNSFEKKYYKFSGVNSITLIHSNYWTYDFTDISAGIKLSITPNVYNTYFDSLIQTSNKYGLIVHNVGEYVIGDEINDELIIEDISKEIDYPKIEIDDEEDYAEALDFKLWKYYNTISIKGRNNIFSDLYNNDDDKITIRIDPDKDVAADILHVNGEVNKLEFWLSMFKDNNSEEDKKISVDDANEELIKHETKQSDMSFNDATTSIETNFGGVNLLKSAE